MLSIVNIKKHLNKKTKKFTQRFLMDDFYNCSISFTQQHYTLRSIFANKATFIFGLHNLVVVVLTSVINLYKNYQCDIANKNKTYELA